MDGTRSSAEAAEGGDEGGGDISDLAGSNGEFDEEWIFTLEMLENMDMDAWGMERTDDDMDGSFNDLTLLPNAPPTTPMGE